MFDLKTPIEQLYLVGPARAKLLKKLEIHTLGDLLFYFPRNHQDLSKTTPIKDLKIGELASIKGRVLEVKSFSTKVRRMNLMQALVTDDSGSIVCLWYNQPFLARVIKPHQTFLFAGKVIKDKGKLILQNPIYEPERKEQIHTARLVPIYSLTANLTQKLLRYIIKTYLDKVTLNEYLPNEILKVEKLLDENTAVKHFHFPKDYADLKSAQNRLAFDEIFQTQVRVLRYKNLRQLLSSYQVKPPDLAEKIKQLPFELTQSQNKTLEEIILDFRKPYPANRILEGDVGSGKTIVGALAALVVAKNGLQTAVLAPTEILAAQHYASLLKFFTDDNISLQLHTSSNQANLADIASGETKIVFGTHALLEETVRFKNLALIIIDEQHRFGVEQRSTLKQRQNAHLLTMSATPIPRTLALTLYGDLDISLLSELPSGRLPIKTELVSEERRGMVYKFISEQIKQGRQAYVICPLIDESDKLGVKSATAEYDKLSKEIFPQFKIGLLHSRLKPTEKEKVMQQFKDNQVHILVSTSVVEVGVDVPNATVMMIEGSERFGLAQLHQSRGRVGRSNYQSYCFLLSHDPNAANNQRLKAIAASNNGFELAEKDLEIRGAGDLYGTAQSGYNFKIANLSNLELVEKSRQYADKLLDEDLSLSKYPALKQKIEELPIVHLE